MTIEFGSNDARDILRADKNLRAEASKSAHLEELPMRKWVVSVEVIVNRYVEARTEEEAMAICGRRYEGEPYDAMPMSP